MRVHRAFHDGDLVSPACRLPSRETSAKRKRNHAAKAFLLCSQHFSEWVGCHRRLMAPRALPNLMSRSTSRTGGSGEQRLAGFSRLLTFCSDLGTCTLLCCDPLRRYYLRCVGMKLHLMSVNVSSHIVAPSSWPAFWCGYMHL